MLVIPQPTSRPKLASFSPFLHLSRIKCLGALCYLPHLLETSCASIANFGWNLYFLSYFCRYKLVEVITAIEIGISRNACSASCEKAALLFNLAQHVQRKVAANGSTSPFVAKFILQRCLALPASGDFQYLLKALCQKWWLASCKEWQAGSKRLLSTNRCHRLRDSSPLALFALYTQFYLSIAAMHYIWQVPISFRWSLTFKIWYGFTGWKTAEIFATARLCLTAQNLHVGGKLVKAILSRCLHALQKQVRDS